MTAAQVESHASWGDSAEPDGAAGAADAVPGGADGAGPRAGWHAAATSPRSNSDRSIGRRVRHPLPGDVSKCATGAGPCVALPGVMRIAALAPAIASLLLAACSGESAAGPGGADSGTPDTGADVGVDAGPCEPIGKWTWTFQAEAGSPRVDHVVVAEGPDAGAGALTVTFLERQVETDQCLPSDAGSDAGPELVVASATLDPATCSLNVGYSQSWCLSGEQQSESWDIDLTFSGSTGQGTATEISGWTMQKFTTTYVVTAQKE